MALSHPFSDMNSTVAKVNNVKDYKYSGGAYLVFARMRANAMCFDII